MSTVSLTAVAFGRIVAEATHITYRTQNNTLGIRGKCAFTMCAPITQGVTDIFNAGITFLLFKDCDKRRKEYSDNSTIMIYLN